MKSRVAHSVVVGLSMLAAFSGSSIAQEAAKAPQFGQFPAEVYKGHIKIPRNLRLKSGMWLDEGGKWVSAPKVNFAGEYYLYAHTCGTCCRYYTLDNVRTGRSVEQVSMFDTGDSPPRTRDGHTYVAILYFRPDSALVIVQYELDFCDVPEQETQCRQRDFVFKDGKFQAISATLRSCTKEGDEPR